MATKIPYILIMTICTTGVVFGVTHLYDTWISTAETSFEKPCGLRSEQNRGHISLGDKQFWEEWNKRCHHPDWPPDELLYVP